MYCYIIKNPCGKHCPMYGKNCNVKAMKKMKSKSRNNPNGRKSIV